jgi:hypothetical protein
MNVSCYNRCHGNAVKGFSGPYGIKLMDVCDGTIIVSVRL